MNQPSEAESRDRAWKPPRQKASTLRTAQPRKTWEPPEMLAGWGHVNLSAGGRAINSWPLLWVYG
ncbi:MAG: hypothetical protein LZ174_09005 [Thaumarchaeota archaeon]|nr:hypothetical protein [Candidatus Geocrenenecus arthurdayi]